MFLGTHTGRLDAKFRLQLPDRFARELTGGSVITKGQENCLYLLPAREFDDLARAAASVPLAARSGREYARVLFSGAAEATPDLKGRIKLPPGLVDYAGLTAECTVVGANRRAEIWASPAWAEYESAADIRFASLDVPSTP